MIHIETNRVYTIGAAGFWLARLKPTPRPTAEETRQKRIGRQLAEYLRMRQEMNAARN